MMTDNHQYQVYRLEVKFGMGPVWVYQKHFPTLAEAEEYKRAQTDKAGYIIRMDGRRIPGVD